MRQMFRSPKFPLIFLLAGMLSACGENYIPKPTAYSRIEMPKKGYQTYSETCPFTFRYPVYSRIEADKSPDAGDCWFNIFFPQFNATIHMSYKPVSSFKNFEEMSEDAHTFAYKHTVKAEDIYDSLFVLPQHHVNGVLYEIEGNTASSIQFYATDSSKHYVRGALYFNTHPNKDSLAPVIHFIRTDIDTLLRSLQWK
jgi:gliding motility-associated lipoprotein GldD